MQKDPSKGKEDAIAGLLPTRYGVPELDRVYIEEYFKGMQETNPSVKILDASLFKEGYLSVLYQTTVSEQQKVNPSFICGRMHANLAMYLEDLTIF